MKKATKFPITVKPPRPPKPPKSFMFDGEAGQVDIYVMSRDGGGITLEFCGKEDDIVLLPGRKGSRFTREFLKFAQKLHTYVTGEGA